MYVYICKYFACIILYALYVYVCTVCIYIRSKCTAFLHQEHEALKAAYHALETESVSRNRSSTNETELRKRMEEAERKAIELQVRVFFLYVLYV